MQWKVWSMVQITNRDQQVLYHKRSEMVEHHQIKTILIQRVNLDPEFFHSPGYQKAAGSIWGVNLDPYLKDGLQLCVHCVVQM